MFYDDSPLSTLLNVGMWGFSFWCGHKSGEAAALKKVEAQDREKEILTLRLKIYELERRVNAVPPAPPKER